LGNRCGRSRRLVLCVLTNRLVSEKHTFDSNKQSGMSTKTKTPPRRLSCSACCCACIDFLNDVFNFYGAVFYTQGMLIGLVFTLDVVSPSFFLAGDLSQVSMIKIAMMEPKQYTYVFLGAALACLVYAPARTVVECFCRGRVPPTPPAAAAASADDVVEEDEKAPAPPAAPTTLLRAHEDGLVETLIIGGGTVLWVAGFLRSPIVTSSYDLFYLFYVQIVGIGSGMIYAMASLLLDQHSVTPALLPLAWTNSATHVLILIILATVYTTVIACQFSCYEDIWNDQYLTVLFNGISAIASVFAYSLFVAWRNHPSDKKGGGKGKMNKFLAKIKHTKTAHPSSRCGFHCPAGFCVPPYEGPDPSGQYDSKLSIHVSLLSSSGGGGGGTAGAADETESFRPESQPLLQPLYYNKSLRRISFALFWFTVAAHQFTYFGPFFQPMSSVLGAIALSNASPLATLDAFVNGTLQNDLDAAVTQMIVFHATSIGTYVLTGLALSCLLGIRIYKKKSYDWYVLGGLFQLEGIRLVQWHIVTAVGWVLSSFYWTVFPESTGVFVGLGIVSAWSELLVGVQVSGRWNDPRFPVFGHPSPSSSPHLDPIALTASQSATRLFFYFLAKAAGQGLFTLLLQDNSPSSSSSELFGDSISQLSLFGSSALLASVFFSLVLERMWQKNLLSHKRRRG